MTLDKGTQSYPKILQVSPQAQNVTPEKDECFLATAALNWDEPTIDATPASLKRLLELQANGKKPRNALITAALASTFSARDDEFQREIEQLTDSNIRAMWTPTASNFFSRVAVPYLDKLFDQLIPLDEDDERRKAFHKLKKGEKAKELGDLFSNAGVQESYQLSRDTIKAIDAWLPEEML